MTEIHFRKARVRRTKSTPDGTVAELSVMFDGKNYPYLVNMARTGTGWEVTRVLENDADVALDWYDNDLHQAFADRTESFLNRFGGARGMAEHLMSDPQLKEQLSDLQ